MTRMLVRALLVATVVLAAVNPASSGTINGVVKFAGPPPAEEKTPVTIDQYICGKEVAADRLVVSSERGLKNAVVFLKSAPRNGGVPLPTTVSIDQKQCVFVPRVVIVPVGGTVQFLNSDRLLHNLHSHGTANPGFNRTQPTGRTIPVRFDAPEIVRVVCDLHAWMQAWVVVAEHPFYAVTDEHGRFTLKNVPRGTYTLAVWQETLGTTTRDVTATDATSTVTVEVGKK